MYRQSLKYRKRRIRHGVNGIIGNNLQPKKWVFIIGCYNSGTTLLRDILSSHFEINALQREGVELCSQLPRPEEIGWPRMWHKCPGYLRIPTNGSHARARKIKRQWSHYVSDQGLIVEKSISNMLRLDFLSKYFQPAYFIHIVRNGFAVSEGIRRRSQPNKWGSVYKTYPIELCAKQWVASDEMIRLAKSNLPNLLEISYEALTENTKKTLSSISDFLEIQTFEAKVYKQNWEIHGIRSQIRNMNVESFAKLSQVEIQKIEMVAKKSLSEYGYRIEQ